MKYEEWIKYEEARLDQPDHFAWITYADLPAAQKATPSLLSAPKPASTPQRKPFWLSLSQRFISRRI